MNREQSVIWLKMLGATVSTVQARSTWTTSDCPLGPWKHEGGKSSSEVFGVKVEAGDSFCNCFSCGFHGKQTDLIFEMRRLNKQQFHQKYAFGEALQLIAQAEEGAELEGLNAPSLEEMLTAAKKEMHEFPQWWLDSFAKIAESSWGMAYVTTGREDCDPVPLSVLEALDVRVDTLQRRVCFPVRDFQGRLMGLHGRATVPGDEPRYRMYLQGKHNNPLVWLGESWVDLNKPIVVVEGPFDLASVYRVYRNVVSPLFVNPSVEKLMRMSDAMEWVTFYDHGVGGDTGRRKVENALPNNIVSHARPPKGKKDPGAMTVTQLQEILSPFVKLDTTLD